MAAADGSLGRSSEDQQDAAAVVVVAPGPLWTIKQTRDSRITQDHNIYFTTDIHLIPESGL